MRWPWQKPLTVVPPPAPAQWDASAVRQQTSRMEAQNNSVLYPIKPPELHPLVVPKGHTAPVLAMDSGQWNYLNAIYNSVSGFPGYPYLSELATKPEYRAFATAYSTELTREWITITSTEADDKPETKEKITQLTKAVDDCNLQKVIQTMAEHDYLFGRGQMFINLRDQSRNMPLILSPRTIPLNSFVGISAVEALWTTPSAYNTLDPAASDFYRPNHWWMVGQEVHASRLTTVITKPVPDMLKAAYNFGGISMSQLAEPYVNNWLRTRQSVSNLIDKFSIIALATQMGQILTAAESDGASLFDRIKLFNATRSNQGTMLIDKDLEELVQIAVPLSGLHELKAQDLELLCFVSKTPSTILLGIAPSGFGNVAEGEIAAWENWIHASQESNWRIPIKTVIDVIQLSLFGAIDPNIVFTFNPLRQMTPKELSEIRKADAEVSQIYASAGAIDGQDIREKIARDPDSEYQGLDLSKEIEPMEDDDEDSGDDDDANDNPFGKSGADKGVDG